MLMSIQIKRGDSFQELINLPTTYGDGYFTSWTLSSQIRTARYLKLIADLSPVWVDPITTHIIQLSHTDTTDWPIGAASIDIQLTSPSGFIISTKTIDVDIIQDITFPIDSVVV
jgi:hypothetical protein